MKQLLGPLFIGLVATLSTPLDSLAGEWGIGLGVAGHESPHGGAEPKLAGCPFPFYEGERLSVGFGSLSYALVNAGKFRLALEGQARFDGYDPKKSKQLAGMEKRSAAFDVGFSLTTAGLWGQAQLKILADVTGTHHGYEVNATYQLPLEAGRWTVIRSIGLNWRSNNLVDYYYGVRTSEALDGRPGYAGRSTTNAFAGLTVDYKLSDHWHVLGGGDYVYLGDGIKDSPIIAKNHEATVFGAVIYRF